MLQAAHREFTEETGFVLAGPTLPLTAVRQRGGKIVHVWAVEADLDPAALRSGSFPLEWPPDRAPSACFPNRPWRLVHAPDASQMILAAQVPLLDELRRLADPGGHPAPKSRRPDA